MWNRLHTARFKTLARQFPAVLILGPRQVGKTTLARTAFPKETGSGRDFRIWKYGRWDSFIQARDLGGLGILDPGLEGKDGAMTGRGFAAPGNTGGSGIGPERALEAITPTLRAQRESIPLPELPCERRPGPAEPDTKAHHRTS